MPTRRSIVGAMAGAACVQPLAAAPARRLVEGIVWQPSLDSVSPDGQWHRLGASTLLVQWTEVDGISFIPGLGSNRAGRVPDWGRIAARPWARKLILGLAGRFDGHAAQADTERLARTSLNIARAASQRIAAASGTGPRLDVAGWYFPVEVDPTWQQPQRIARAISVLPRPLWISVFDNANIGPEPFADWVAGWLPRDVGVFFQDGVGLHKRQPQVAVAYYRRLGQTLGASRLRLIAEAFRVEGAPDAFRPARPAELLPQLRAYAGLPVFLFEGPQYLPDESVAQTLALCASAGHEC